ncbi:hypothetical protein GV794_10570 [Nocardia cyriacigeorgica]|uniref:HNH nuclease domain-containing protein n=1 Tax=Nocardia cyriacigeorgica TaxID=135487 RepID=A0A6P1DA22_9NOCA|nr:HNH endonuclease [Nocardia cyriacigeorgica]NEW46469.1 hypothetical protein [Nocardia cyriacigeorgica]NEW53531.1 hypothetical protein [Nocardia cyriacigeorgica]NEW56093.1 hypothetical protein [Nocardia cyriacigeorgica]
MLEAAPIVPDAHEHGIADIPNGLSLCRIHHTAYDRNLIGVFSDMKIHVGEEIMSAANEGPILELGLQQLDKADLQLPIARKFYPSEQRLAARFEQFTMGVRASGRRHDISWPSSDTTTKIVKSVAPEGEFAANE